MRRITLVAIALAVVMLLAGGLLWQLRRSPSEAASAPPPHAVSASPTPSVPAPTLAKDPIAAASGSATAPVLGGQDVDEDGNARPQPVPLPASAHPPPLDGPHSKPAPPQQGFTREETITKREADLKLLDDTKTRLESELAAARTSGDKTAVHDLEIRIARTTNTRKLRSEELDKIRARGELPK